MCVCVCMYVCFYINFMITYNINAKSSPGNCPAGSLPCLFNDNCYDFDELCNRVNDCNDTLASDELQGFFNGQCSPSGTECKCTVNILNSQNL